MVYVRPSPFPDLSDRNSWFVVALPCPESMSSTGLASGSWFGPPSPPATSRTSTCVLRFTVSGWALSVAVTEIGWNLWFGGHSLSGPLYVTVWPLPQSSVVDVLAY